MINYGTHGFQEQLVFVIFFRHITACFPTRRPGRLRQLWRWRSSWRMGHRWPGRGCTCLFRNSRFWSRRRCPGWFGWLHRWSRCSQRAHGSPGCWNRKRLRLMEKLRRNGCVRLIRLTEVKSNFIHLIIQFWGNGSLFQSLYSITALLFTPLHGNIAISTAPYLPKRL